MRIVYLDHVARLSGAELALMRLLEALGDRVAGHVLLAEDGPLVERLRHTGAVVDIIPMTERTRGLSRGELRLGPGIPVAVVDAVSYTISLARRLKQLGPDLVHANSLKAAVCGVPAARAIGLPVVWHLHDRLDADYLPSAAVRPLRVFARTLPQAIVANSEATMGTLHLPPGPRPLRRVIPYVISTVERLVTVTHRPMRVGMIGRIAPWKGQHVLLEAFAKAFPNGDTELVVVGSPMFGSDEERYEDELHARAARLGIAGRVHFAGFREDVAAQLRSFDVLVHASVIPEPFGQVIAEGMAAGLPVIAASGGGAAEIVRHERTGLLYPPGDTDALASALIRLMEDPSLRHRLGSEGTVRAREYSPERIATQMYDLYRQVLIRRRAAQL